MIKLPEVDIFAEEYIVESRQCDRCSCSPDTLFGIYFGMACKRHDDDYKFISNNADKLTFLQRCKLKWNADSRLHDGIAEAFRRKGKEGGCVAEAYRLVVARCNWIYRVWKALTLQSL